jgi:hypothetical protein
VVKAPRDGWHVLTGCYALDALPEHERKEFERHLPHCSSCDAEVSGLRETAARLATPKAAPPPPGLRDRVLAATYRTRQLPPLPGEHAGLGRRPELATRSGADRLAAGRAFRNHRRFRMPRLAAAVAAAASLAIAVGVGATQVASHHQLQSAKTGGAAIARVIMAPDARTESARARGGGSVTVVVSARQREAVVTAAGMPSLPSTRVYQVWVIGSAGAQSAGLLSSAGQTSQLLAAGVRPGDRIGITVEPAGGTSRPTTAPIVVMAL